MMACDRLDSGLRAVPDVLRSFIAEGNLALAAANSSSAGLAIDCKEASKNKFVLVKPTLAFGITSTKDILFSSGIWVSMNSMAKPRMPGDSSFPNIEKDLPVPDRP